MYKNNGYVIVLRNSYMERDVTDAKRFRQESRTSESNSSAVGKVDLFFLRYCPIADRLWANGSASALVIALSRVAPMTSM
jgi:hypothetical protein